jgi:hypothetical protein
MTLLTVSQYLNLNCSQDIIRVVKLKKTRWVRHVACMTDMVFEFHILLFLDSFLQYLTVEEMQLDFVVIGCTWSFNYQCHKRKITVQVLTSFPHIFKCKKYP